RTRLVLLDNPNLVQVLSLSKDYARNVLDFNQKVWPRQLEKWHGFAEPHAAAANKNKETPIYSIFFASPNDQL
ncbi:MAG: hypothetical protein HY539_00470, partial [Deltaproteobacteria bacterium]|nr:hypothetical protein [Deltaproteobacteria bacterium]